MSDSTDHRHFIEKVQHYYANFLIKGIKVFDKSAGQFNHVVCVNEEWIFRFPKNQSVAKEVAREVHILEQLRGKLPLPIPEPEYLAYHPDNNQLEFMAYKMLPGEPLLREKFALIQEDEAILEQIAFDIAKFLQSLHSLEPDLIVPDEKANDSRQEWEQLYRDFQEQLFPYMRDDAKEAVSQNFDAALADDALWQVEPKLIHGDFGTGNILYQDGHISGIIDFTFCAVDNPAQEVGALISSYGEAFVERVLTHYPELRQSLPCARFMRTNYALIQALYGLRDRDNEAFEDGIQDYR